MKKLIIFLVILLVILLLGVQFLLPSLVEKRITNKINETFHPTTAAVHVESSPAFKMLWGSIDTIKADMSDVSLDNGLKVSHINVDLHNVNFSVKDIFNGGKFTPTSIGAGTMTGTFTEKDLTEYLKTKVKGLDDLNVTVESDKLKLNGHFNIGGIVEGEASTMGMMEIHDNALLYAPERFSINGFGINGINMPIMKEIVLYNFNDFPIPVKLTQVNTDKNKVNILLNTKVSE